MKVRAEEAQRFIRVNLPRGYILLTWGEMERALARAKAESRRESNDQRTRSEGSLLEALGTAEPEIVY